jgi:hypothetical protein
MMRFFSALSLKAVWNWVAMRHQKPRRQPATATWGVSCMQASQPTGREMTNLIAP